MTIKFYKKRIHWYYIYEGEEYRINMNNVFDKLSNILQKNTIYLKFKKGSSDQDHLFLWQTDWAEIKFSEGLKILFKLMQANFVNDNIVVPSRLIHGVYIPIEIVNIW